MRKSAAALLCAFALPNAFAADFVCDAATAAPDSSSWQRQCRFSGSGLAQAFAAYNELSEAAFNHLPALPPKNFSGTFRGNDLADSGSLRVRWQGKNSVRVSQQYDSGATLSLRLQRRGNSVILYERGSTPPMDDAADASQPDEQ